MRFDYNYVFLKGIVALQKPVTIKMCQENKMLKNWIKYGEFKNVILGWNPNDGFEIISGDSKELTDSDYNKIYSDILND